MILYPAWPVLQINEFDARICPSLGPGSAEQCQAAAEALLPVAIEYLRQSTSPAQLCAASGVCATHPLQASRAQACTVLPPELAATCTDLVTNYGSLLMGLVEQLDPAEVVNYTK
ncbi:hypothetical protein HaLaN_23113, partial [Haematococcus lacustris]